MSSDSEQAPNILKEEAIGLSKRSRFYAASKKFEQALEFDKTNAELYNQFGLSLLDAQRYPDAIEKFKKAVEYSLSYDFDIEKFSDVLNHAADQEKHIQHFQEIVDKKNSSDLFHRWGQVLVSISQQMSVKSSSAEPNKVVGFNTKLPTVESGFQPTVQTFQTSCYYDEAIDQFKQALKKNPKIDLDYASLLIAIKGSETTEYQVRSFQKEVDENSKDRKKIFEKFLILSREYSFSDIEEFKKELEQPISFETYLFLGQMLIQIDKLDEAIKNYDEAIEKYPDKMKNVSSLGYFDSLLEAIQKPSNPDEHIIKKYQEALDKAFDSLYPLNYSIFLKWGDFLYGLGKKKDSAIQYAKSIAIGNNINDPEKEQENINNLIKVLIELMGSEEDKSKVQQILISEENNFSLKQSGSIFFLMQMNRNKQNLRLCSFLEGVIFFIDLYYIKYYCLQSIIPKELSDSIDTFSKIKSILEKANCFAPNIMWGIVLAEINYNELAVKQLSFLLNFLDENRPEHWQHLSKIIQSLPNKKTNEQEVALNKIEEFLDKKKSSIFWINWCKILCDLQLYDRVLNSYCKALYLVSDSSNPDNIELFTTILKDFPQRSSHIKEIDGYINIQKCTSYKVFYAWGKILDNLGEKNLVIQQYEKAIKAKENKDDIAGIYVAMGKHYTNQGHYSEAIKQFKKAESNNPKYAKTFFEWGTALLKFGQKEDAIKIYTNAISVDPNQTVSILIELVSVIQSIQILNWNDDDINNLQKKIDSLPQEDNEIKAKIYHQWGVLLSQLRYFDRSIEQQKKSVELDPDMDKYEKNWKDWRKAIGKANSPDKSVQEYELAIESYRKSADAYTEWGDLFRCQGWFEKAKDQYQNALKINSKCLLAHEGLLFCLLQLHDVLQIDVIACELLAYEPTNEKAHNRLIYAANLKRDFDMAIQYATQYTQEGSEKGVDWWKLYINWALALHNKGQNDEAIKTYEDLLQKQSSKDLNDTNKAEIYYYYGNLLLSTKRYEEADIKFQKAIELKSDYVYAYHNRASISFEIQRQYEDSWDKWKKTLDAYDQLEPAIDRAVDKGDYVDSHEFYYRAQILQSIHHNNEEAENILQQGLAFNPQDTLILSGLASLKWEEKGECLETGLENARKQSACHWQAMDYFQQAERLLKQRLDRSKLYDDLIELGNLYFIIDDYEKASKLYQDARDMNDKAALPNAKLGVTKLRLKKIIEAIPLLEKSLKINPDELDVKSSLAEAYLRDEKLEEADKYYREILSIAPNHVQSLIGLGETCTAWGDKKETDRYSEAIVFFEQALKVADKREIRSKYLTKSEKAKVNYLLGYTYVQRYENSKLHHRNSEITDALSCFKACQKLNPSYQKAKRAIDKINKQYQPLTETWLGQRIILILSFGIFALAQSSFYFNLPPLTKLPSWSITESSLKLVKDKVPEAEKKKLDPLKNESFSSKDEPLDKLDGLDIKIDSKKMAEVKKLVAENITKNPGSKGIEGTSYFALTFGSLMFIVIGLYLPQVLKLSVAGISLEKSTLDQSQAGGSLGIAK